MAPIAARRALTGAVLLIGLSLFILRRPSGLLEATIWAEDGRQFFADALTPGPDVGVYAGQWWPTQRLSASLVAAFPVTTAPVAFYLLSCLLAVLAAGTVLLQRARPLFGSRGYQFLAFFLVLLTPIAWEVQGNVTNIQVWLAVGLLVVLVLPPPGSRLGRLSEVGFVTIAGLTGFLGVLLTPVAVWSLITRRERYAATRSGLLLTTAAVNVLVWSGADRPPRQGALGGLLTVPEALLQRWGGGSVLGEFPLRTHWSGGVLSWWAVPAAAYLAVLLWAVWRDRRGPSPAWLLTAGLWVLLAVLSPTGAFGASWVLDASAHWRYFAMGITTGFLILVRALGTSEPRWPVVVGLTACLPAIAVGYRLPPQGPAIPETELRAFAECIESREDRCSLPIAPGPGWAVEVPR